MSEQVYVVEIKPPDGGDDEWLIAYYAQHEHAPDTFAMAVFGNARDAEKAARTFRHDKSMWVSRVRSATLAPKGNELHASGRGL